jgi:respiratory nitrate reductase gamma subunit
MTVTEALLWVALPYVSTAIFIGGLIWRYQSDQFGWTSRSTQILESRLLAPGSILFHYGALAAIGGHFLGILVPETLTNALGITEAYYHIISAGAGTVASIALVAGLVILIYRRITIRRVWVTTTYLDIAVYILLTVVILLGVWDTVATNTVGGGYDYRSTVAVWFRSLAIFQPNPSVMKSVPMFYQIHASIAWLLYALWPFSRLVHAFSYPFQYLGRPYILYRRRFAAGRR